MTEGRIRYATIGCGTGGRLTADAVPRTNQKLTGAELVHVAACDPDPTRLAAFCRDYSCAGYSDVGALLAACATDLDFVHVATPSGMHHDPILAILRTGVDVLSDKPLETSCAKMEYLVSQATTLGRRLFIVSQNRWILAVQLIADAAKAGRFGAHVSGRFRLPWYRPDAYYTSLRWRGTWQFDGGAALINQGIHGMDLLTWLLALATGVSRAELVQGVSARIARRCHSAEVLEAEDLVYARLALAGGGQARIVATTASQNDGPWTIEIHGSTGRAVVNERGELLVWEFDLPHELDSRADALRDVTTPTVPGGSSNPAAVGTANHAAMLVSLCNAIRSGASWELEGAEGAFAGLLIRRIYGAARDPQQLRPDGFQP